MRSLRGRVRAVVVALVVLAACTTGGQTEPEEQAPPPNALEAKLIVEGLFVPPEGVALADAATGFRIFSQDCLTLLEDVELTSSIVTGKNGSLFRAELNAPQVSVLDVCLELGVVYSFTPSSGLRSFVSTHQVRLVQDDANGITSIVQLNIHLP